MSRPSLPRSSDAGEVIVVDSEVPAGGWVPVDLDRLGTGFGARLGPSPAKELTSPVAPGVEEAGPVTKPAGRVPDGDRIFIGRRRGGVAAGAETGRVPVAQAVPVPGQRFRLIGELRRRAANENLLRLGFLLALLLMSARAAFPPPETRAVDVWPSSNPLHIVT